MNYWHPYIVGFLSGSAITASVISIILSIFNA